MAIEPASDTSFGVVVIGRNEGERLKACLTSVTRYTDKLVYVDSGSSDDSVNMARDMGAAVVELDMRIPFTAARARNEGFNKLGELSSQIKYVQFVDGDCEVVEGWLQSAVTFLEQNDHYAVVCGRRRERFPDRSVYNMLCDMEWNTPVGETRSCGGDAMMRVDAFSQVSGFNGDLIAGEEPELCVRLRNSGWKIRRLDCEMTLHDAGITQFGQWWKRSVRAGYACAEGKCLHGRSPGQHKVKELRSIWIWGLLIPCATLFSLCVYGPWSLGILLIYPAQILRLSIKGDRGLRVNFLRAYYLVLAKFPEMLGAVRFTGNRIFNTHSRIIEYK